MKEFLTKILTHNISNLWNITPLLLTGKLTNDIYVSGVINNKNYLMDKRLQLFRNQDGDIPAIVYFNYNKIQFEIDVINNIIIGI